jgi:hypothetical protein
MSRALILALCLCLAGSSAVRAAVDDAEAFCPGADEGMPGGWTMLTEDLPQEVNDFLAGNVSQTVAGHLELRRRRALCMCPAACSQEHCLTATHTHHRCPYRGTPP